jgi:uncharacterized membrane protein YfcA
MDFFYLPSEISNMTAMLMIVVSLVTSFISAAAGIGGGLMMLAFLSALLPPMYLVPIHGIIQFGSNFFRATLSYKEISKGAIIPFVLGCLIGSTTGGFIFTNLPTNFLKFGIAFFILWSVFGSVPTIKSKLLFPIGFLVSLISMLFGASGFIMVAVVKSMKLPPVNHVATHGAMMTFQHLIKCIVFGIFGFSFASYAPLVVAMIVSGFFGTLIGKQFLIKKGQYYFKTVLNIFLIFAAIRLVWSAVQSM